MTNDRPYRAGGLKMSRTVEGSDDDSAVMDGEALVAELMATVVSATLIEGKDGVRVLLVDAGFPRFAVDPFNWVAMLRNRGWSVTVDGESVTFAIVRG
jgi:hypothetical protein